MRICFFSKKPQNSQFRKCFVFICAHFCLVFFCFKNTRRLETICRMQKPGLQPDITDRVLFNKWSQFSRSRKSKWTSFSFSLLQLLSKSSSALNQPLGIPGPRPKLVGIMLCRLHLQSKWSLFEVSLLFVSQSTGGSHAAHYIRKEPLKKRKLYFNYFKDTS